MARARSLTALLADVRYRADMVNDAHVTDTMLTVWINQGIAELWGILTRAWPDRYYVTSTFNTVAGTEAYAVPADFVKIRGLDLQIQGQRIPVHQGAFQERVGPGTGNTLGYFGIPDMTYTIRRAATIGMSVYLDPIPTSVLSMRLHYIGTPTLLAVGADEFDGVAGWEDYAVEFARALALERSEQDSTPARVALATLKQRIKTEAAETDAAEQSVIADVRGVHGRWRGRF